MTLHFLLLGEYTLPSIKLIIRLIKEDRLQVYTAKLLQLAGLDRKNSSKVDKELTKSDKN